jgi:hypothetical protein
MPAGYGARVGYPVCGDGTIVGAALYNEIETIRWAIEIAWDGHFSGANEAIKLTDLETTRGRKGYVRVQQDSDNRVVVGFKYVDFGKATVQFLDSAGRYNPTNTASDLYPNVKRGIKARIWNQYGLGGPVNYLFTGYIAEIKHTPGRPGYTRIDLVDSLKNLADAAVDIALQTNQTASDAIGLLLDDLDWPEDERNIETSTDAIPYWWTQGRRALTEMRDLADAELGKIFTDALGRVCFYTRNHAISSKLSLTESLLAKDMRLEQPEDTRRNYFEVRIKPRKLQSSAVLFEMTDKPMVRAGATEEYFGQLTYNGTECPADNLLNPTPTTDYTMNTLDTGAGTDLTSSFSVTVQNLGSRVKVTVTNNSASDGYITLLKVWGEAITTQGTVTRTSTDQASIAELGRLMFVYQTDWMQTVNVGETLVSWLQSLLSGNGNVVSVQMRARPDIQFAVDLFDGVTATLPTLGLAEADYAVGYIKHKFLGPTGQDVQTTLQLEGLITIEGAGVYDTGVYDTAVYAP